MMARKAKNDPRDEAAEAHEAAPETPETPESGQPGGEETGAPATEDGAPSIDELVPGLDEALGGDAAVDSAGDSAALIAALEAEKAETKDQLLRALAELENTRRRAERDRRDAEAYGGTRLARDLLVVYDNLNRALDAADDALRAEHGPFLEGLELTRRELLSAFSRHGIAKVTPERGQKFDPHLHQAMFEAPVPGAENGTIIEVMEDGFTISDRLLRPARVGVAKGGAVAAAAPAAETGEASADDAEAEG